MQVNSDIRELPVRIFPASAEVWVAWKRLPHYPVPAAILGRLAVDRRYQGRGLGALMLADAIKRLVRASESLAIYALIADAKNDGAKAFYEHFGFQAFPDASMRLFMPLGRFIKS